MHSIKISASTQVTEAHFRIVLFIFLLLSFFPVPYSAANEYGVYSDSLAQIESESEATQTLISSLALLSFEIEINGNTFEFYPRNMVVENFSRSEKRERISGYEKSDVYQIAYTLDKDENSRAMEIKIEMNTVFDTETPVVNMKLLAGELTNTDNQHGFASLYSYLKPILLNQKKQIDLDSDTEMNERECLGCWLGYRTQSNAYLVLDKSEEISTVTFKDDVLSKSLGFETVNTNQTQGNAEIRLATLLVYNGPVEYNALSRTNEKSLMNMMYSHLWDWVRYLVFGIKTLAYFLFSLIGNWGLAIMLLAFGLRIILLPISLIAERYQKEAIQNQQLLKPSILEIKSKYKGEEQSVQLFKLYESHGIHPLSGFKGFLGLAIQLPVLIAIFAFLSELQPISGVSFLWIKDLSHSDALFNLPFVIPFFGGSFNLLPFIMLLISNLSSFIGIDRTLSSDALKTQRKNTFLLSFVFFILFYSFPAAMVLYWTSSVFFEVVQRMVITRIINTEQAACN